MIFIDTDDNGLVELFSCFVCIVLQYFVVSFAPEVVTVEEVSLFDVALGIDETITFCTGLGLVVL